MPAAVVAVAAAGAGYWAAGAAVSAGWVAAGAAGSMSVGAAMVAAGVSLSTSSVMINVFGDALGLTQKTQNTIDQMARGVLLNTSSTVDPIPVIYGTRRIGGTRVLCEASGVKNEYLHIIVVHCEGEIAAISNVYFDDVLVDSPNSSGDVTTGKYAGLVHIEKFLGTDGQAACQTLVNALPGKWTAAHKLSGLAYTYVRLKYDGAKFSGLPTITVDVQGRKVYDPRTGDIGFTNNPALCIRDYLTNPRFGRAIPVSQIDEDSFVASANFCDSTFVDASGVSKALYACDGVANTEQSSAENVINLLSCCRGMLVFSARGYGLLIDKAEVPTSFEFSEDNIIGSWQISLGDKRNTYNRVRGNWFNPSNSWQPDIFVADSPDFRESDNGLMLEAGIQLPFTTDSSRAQLITQRYLRQSRFGIRVVFKAFIAGMFCEVGDVVPISHSTPGWSKKPFRIVRISLLSSDEVEIEAHEYDDSVYSSQPLVAPRISQVTNLPDMTEVPPPLNVSAVSDGEWIQVSDGVLIPRIKIAFDYPDDVFVVGYEIEWSKSGGEWLKEPLALCSPCFIYPVDLYPEYYDIRVRSVNSNKSVSVWVYTQRHRVVTKHYSQIPALSGIFMRPNLGQIIFQCNRPDSPLFDGIEVHISTVDGFQPSPATLAYNGPDTQAAIAAMPDGSDFPLDTPLFVMAAGYTSASKDPLNYSEQKTVTVTDSKASLYSVVIESSGGSVFRGDSSTMLTARVFRNGKEVTDQIPDYGFSWTRKSLIPPVPPDLTDAQWNAGHAAGFKRVLVTSSDVVGKAVFSCDVSID